MMIEPFGDEYFMKKAFAEEVLGGKDTGAGSREVGKAANMNAAESR